MYNVFAELLRLTENEQAFRSQVLRTAAKAISLEHDVFFDYSAMYRSYLIIMNIENTHGNYYLPFYFNLPLDHVMNQLYIQEIERFVREHMTR